ncbi:GntR family transcriptional regulator [Roseateles depolymerans]|uniref:Transcriptional regulator, GntR family n=1 Tax=Roseateles depolymerans TaxID=76731 RepID=A0A0U3N839_9BURK|nr:GntR family transcriptional regulator [Roseateles depolymerans]ALV04720.1 Transcriptional regulator, GntR family [Roseateles depolymerans]REG15269.1 DNA-binding GntR family transcriptional regulator [Roseateles depolymerans]
MGTSATDISQRIIEAVLAQKLPPATRLGEQQLALLFDCSRTIVREALTRLAARGIVTVSARRGWYLIAPSQEEAREAFEARRVIELGLIRGQQGQGGLDPMGLARLRGHLQQEHAAVRGDDVGTRSFLLGDFHVCLAECLGNSLLADTLRDFTARTTLIAMLYQSSHDAAQSCQEHVAIVDALERGDLAAAEALMADHLTHVQAGLQLPANSDPLHLLRQALAPVPGAGAQPSGEADDASPQGRSSRASRSSRSSRAPRSASSASPLSPRTSNDADDPPAAYLGALL